MEPNEEKLKELEAKLQTIRQKEQAEEANIRRKGENNQNMSAGARAGMEFIVSILASAAIGYYIDKYFGTSPTFLLIFILAGTAAGFLTIYKISQNLGTGVGFAPLQNTKKQCKETVQQKSGSNDETK